MEAYSMCSEGQFTAKAASLGYAYQFRYALLLALKRHQTGPNWAIATEAADDLECVSDNDDAILQLKHRAAGTSLTDGSVDLWKTLRVWSEALSAGTLRLPETQLALVTTASASPNTACASLTAECRSRKDDTAIAGRLRYVAQASSNTALETAHAAYLRITHDQQAELVAGILILSDSPDIGQVDDKIRALARLMVREAYLDAFMERLEGWWNRRCLRQLVRGFGAAVQGDEFDALLSELREEFHQDNLPIDDDIADERPEIEPFLQEVFCRQLALIELGVSRLAIAVRDYHRAFVQRSRWSHGGLLQYGELDRYERRLREAWELLFERTKEELGSSATDQMKLAAAKNIYAWAEGADFPIRPACTEGFVSRGSLHMLADKQEVGWHPDFELRLAEILSDEPIKAT